MVEIDIPAEPSKLAVPVTAPETAIALAVGNVAAEPVVSWLSVPTTKSIVPVSYTHLTLPTKA